MKRAQHLTLVVALFLAACSSSPTAEIRNWAAPMPGVYTSGQPTAEQFGALSSKGITRVIQLRPAGEKGTGWEEERAKEAGVEFVRLPIDGAKGLTRENVERFAAELAKPTDAATLVCCGSSNRVGALFALKAAWLDGQDKDGAMTLGRAAGMTRLEPVVDKALK